MPGPPSIPTGCPPLADLQELVAGKFAQADASELAAHVASCNACQQMIAALSKSPAKSPASTVSLLGDISSVGEALEGAAVLLPDLAPATAIPAPVWLADRYEVGEEIARGGMGVVHRAIDLSFRREVAVKLLQPRWDREPDARRRLALQAQAKEAFRYEAEITARLQHPGIPPVHELGRSPDGVPFLAMKLIQGNTLQELLSARQSCQADLPRWLQVFEQIAQAVGYAHSRGILHRDLKPQNIMVGEFGEVQVMDWGLAKKIGSAEPAAGLPVSDEQDRLFASRPGDVKGTLAYMPPEQARGEIELLDPRADVFGLGAILCQILTGGAPYTGGSVSEVHAQAMAGELSAAQHRIRASGADEDLIELALRCLSAERTARPENGTAVAQGVAAHRARVEQRLQQAKTEHALSQQQLVEQSRRRKLWYGIAATLLLLLLGSGGFGVYAARSNIIIADREKQARSAANLAAEREQQAQAAAALAQQREQEAKTATKKAVEQEKIAQDQAAISKAVGDFLKYDLLELVGSDQQHRAGVPISPNLKVRDIVRRAVKNVDGKFPDQPRVEAEVRSTLALALATLGDYEESAAQSELVYQLCLKLHGPDHPDTLRTQCGLARVYGAAGDNTRALELLEEVLPHQQKILGQDHKDTIDTMLALGVAYITAADFDQAIPHLEATHQLSRAALGPTHLITFQSALELASANYKQGQTKLALQQLEELHQAEQAALGRENPEVLRTQHQLALYYLEAGDLERALRMFESLVKLRTQQLGVDHPETISTMSNLGLAYYRTGQPRRAVPLFEQTLKLAQDKLGAEHAETLTIQSATASALRAIGQVNRALPLFEQVLQARTAQNGPEHPETLSAMSMLATAYCDTQQFTKALPLLEKAFEHSLEKAGEKHPNTMAFRNNLANAYHEAGQSAKALPHFETVLALVREELGSHHPRTFGCLLGLALAEIELQKYSAAESHLREVWDGARRFRSPLREQFEFEAALEFVELYQASDKKDELEKWQAELKRLTPNGK